MGGPKTCSTMISGNTPEETVDSGMKHVAESHPEMLKNIKAMSKEETAEWMADFRKKWDALPEK